MAVVDFDKIGGGPPMSWESVTYQTSRLRNAISHAKLPDGVKMLPFVGLDLRKVSETDDVDTLFDALLDSCGGMRSGQARQNVEALESGDIIGVKLYPRRTSIGPVPVFVVQEPDAAFGGNQESFRVFDLSCFRDEQGK